MGVDWEAVSGFDAGTSPPAGLLNRLGVVPEVDAAVEAAGAAELPPPRPLPRLGNSDVPDDAVVVGAPAVAVVVAPVVAAVLAGAAGLPKPKPPPVEAGVELPAVENMLLEVPAEEAAPPVFPPRLRAGAPLDAGCEEDGCAAGVAPRLKAGFAGVEEGVVLPSPPKRPPAGLGVCESCAPDDDVWFPPPKRFDEGAEAGVALLFASAPVFPPRLRPPRGFAADCPEVAPPKRPGPEDEVVVAGFAPPKSEDPPPLAWLLCWPNKEEPDWAPPLDWVFWVNKLLPGGAPAGVVEGRKDVLFVAGVADGAEPMSYVSRRMEWVECV